MYQTQEPNPLTGFIAVVQKMDLNTNPKAGHLKASLRWEVVPPFLYQTLYALGVQISMWEYPVCEYPMLWDYWAIVYCEIILLSCLDTNSQDSYVSQSCSSSVS